MSEDRRALGKRLAAFVSPPDPATPRERASLLARAYGLEPPSESTEDDTTDDAKGDEKP